MFSMKMNHHTHTSAFSVTFVFLTFSGSGFLNLSRQTVMMFIFGQHNQTALYLARFDSI